MFGNRPVAHGESHLEPGWCWLWGWNTQGLLDGRSVSHSTDHTATAWNAVVRTRQLWALDQLPHSCHEANLPCIDSHPLLVVLPLEVGRAPVKCVPVIHCDQDWHLHD